METDPPTEQKPHDEGKVDFTCRPTVLTGADEHGGRQRQWVEVVCDYHDETFLSDDHIGLTQNPHFSDNVLYLLLEKQPRRRR